MFQQVQIFWHKNIYNHTASFLHFSTSFVHHQGDIRQKRWPKKAETCGRLAVGSYIFLRRTSEQSLD